MGSFSNQIIEQAEKELERIRIQNKEKKEKAKNEVYEKVPRIKEIDEQIKKRGLETAQRVINGQGSREAIASFRKELTALIKEKKELLKENGFPPRYMELKYKCNKCKDTGVVDNQYCTCREKIIKRLTFKYSGLENIKMPDFNNFDINYYDKNYIHKGISAQVNAARILEYCMNYESGNILFYGDTGLGKTFISGCIAKKMLYKGKIVCYMSAPDMFALLDAVKFGRDISEKSRQQVSLFYDADILIIDDLGTEFRNSFTDSSLFHIINTRLIHEKSTIINTNMGLDELLEAYSERISSRIAGEYKAFKFFGADIRTKIGKKKKVNYY